MYKELALNFIDEDYTTSDGNPISIPSHNSDNPEAPRSLHDAIDSIDPVAPAEVVKSGLFRSDNGKLDMLPLQNALYKSVKALGAAHTVSNSLCENSCEDCRVRYEIPLCYMAYQVALSVCV